MRREHPHDLSSVRLAVGLVIVALGLVFLAANLGWVSGRVVMRAVWPLLFMGVGVLMLRGERRHGRNWGWLFIGGGAWMLADKVGLIDVSFWQVFLPGVLLFAGGTLVWKSLAGPASEEPGPVDEHAEFVRCFAILSGSELQPVSRPFRGADLSAVMGGIKLNLSNARMEGDAAAIDVFAFWGGMEIHVPPDWTVVSKVTTLLGAFIDKRRPTSVVATKTLIVRGTIVMSGIEVKN
jgi:hypothetical protein